MDDQLIAMTHGQLEHCENDIETCMTHAQIIVDRHHKWWAAENKTRLNLRTQLGNKNIEISNIAPRVYKDSHGENPYIKWIQYENWKNRGAQRKWGKPIKPTARGYTEKQLQRYATGWELDMVLSTEAQLKPFRELIDVLHAHKIMLRRKIRKFTNIQEESNDA